MDKTRSLDITILCKVVDNYGDVGFAYRLAHALSSLDGNVRIRFVIDDLASFALLAPGIDSHAAVQQYENWTVFDWNAADVCTASFSKAMPEIVLQCFQCPYPEWLEALLFDKKNTAVVHVVNIDYLTAEDYAEEFHCLKSLTRSSRVQKVNFMPGFTSKTGGLILDRKPAYVPAKKNPDEFSVLIFGYVRDYAPVVGTLSAFKRERRKEGERFSLCAYAAAGQGQDAFMKTHADSFAHFAAKRLPFLPQSEWDDLLYTMDTLFIRGEDSLSRACLSGIPFVWQAYPQEDDYQLVKVEALLHRIKYFFPPDDFAIVENAWRLYNASGASPRDTEKTLFAFLEASDRIKKYFSAFASALIANGDFACSLLDYLRHFAL
ncbi:elongation factor P maturation arginine rhamnosyltransferase EarP [Treponema socranskii]|uniref:elongation factor P maturation arginine rhamnosyltransferase EarP n=1 Tax=Treponema socranskii TaxID=53419 RepID=UPI003D9479AA